MRCDFCHLDMEEIVGWVEGKAMCSQSCTNAYMAFKQHQRQYKNNKWI